MDYLMKPEGLTELRARIDALDDQIIELLKNRIELANAVMSSKAPTRIVDLSREEEIARRYSEKLASASTPEKSKRFVRALLALAKLYPEK